MQSVILLLTMTKRALICCVVILTVCGLINAKRSYHHQCSSSVQCASRYCYGDRCIYYGEAPGDIGMHPCSDIDCGHGNICVLEPQYCTSTPCASRAVCVKNPCRRKKQSK